MTDRAARPPARGSIELQRPAAPPLVALPPGRGGAETKKTQSRRQPHLPLGRQPHWQPRRLRSGPTLPVETAAAATQDKWDLKALPETASTPRRPGVEQGRSQKP